MSHKASLPSWFARAIEALQGGDIDGWMEIYSPDAIHEFPFAPEGATRSLEGHDVIGAYMSQPPSRIRFGSLSNVRVREAGDERIIEATGHHRRIADNTPMDLSYVWFITRRDGKVTHFRDYMNPLAAVYTLDMGRAAPGVSRAGGAAFDQRSAPRNWIRH
jgi:ketosteroid isomerase-like protein